mmetsp:Transcript_15836/g.33853  ORF Transcript_15836/g.33853 Transcript_15836/m.33853 type:complete len:510 (-) Transcript_15836:225-1754(-)
MTSQYSILAKRGRTESQARRQTAVAAIAEHERYAEGERWSRAPYARRDSQSEIATNYVVENANHELSREELVPCIGRALRWVGFACIKACLELVAVEIATDEDNLTNLRLALGPLGPRLGELNVLVHTLEDELLVALLLKAEHSFGAVEILCLSLQQLGHEAVEIGRAERHLRLERHRTHARQVVLLLLLGLLVGVAVVAVLVLSVAVLGVAVRRVLAALGALVPMFCVAVLVVAVLVPVRRARFVRAVGVGALLRLLQVILLDFLLEALERERVEAHQLVHRHARLLAFHQFGEGVDRIDRLLDDRQLLLGHQIRLVENDAVREGNLLHSFVDGVLRPLVVEVREDVLAVDQAEHAVNAEVVHQGKVRGDGLDDGRRVCEAGRLKQHEVKILPAVLELPEGLDQIAAHSAARTTVVHGDQLLRSLHVLLDEGLVNAHSAKLVLDHADLLVVLLIQNVVDKCGLASTKEPGDNSDGKLLLLWELWFLLLIRGRASIRTGSPNDTILIGW